MKLHILTMSRGDSARLKDWLLYHRGIGFEKFHIVLDNPNDDSFEVLEDARANDGIDIEISIHGADGEYFDGISNDDRLRRIAQWKKDNAQRVADSGYPIVDPLSDRQYRVLPGKLAELKTRFPEDWVAVIDVDEYIALPGTADLRTLIERTEKPRLRFLNFNFDMEGWNPGENVRSRIRRWSREDVVAYGNGWENRVKSVVRLDSSLPMVSVHAVSSGPFEIVPPEVGRIHHYKFPNQKISLTYSVEDRSIMMPSGAGRRQGHGEADESLWANEPNRFEKNQVKNLRGATEYQFLAKLIKDLAGDRRVIFSPSKGNWGDGLINYGTRQFFAFFGIGFEELNKSSIQTDLNEGRFRDEVVVIGGGGAWSRNFNGARRVTEQISEQAKSVVVLPTTYDLAAVDADNVVYFARDRYNSCDKVPHAFFCHDMAFFTDLAVAEPSNRVWRLFAMRDDREGHGIGKLVANNFDISRLGDGDYRFVDPLFNIVNNFKLVCTDRMHVAIVGAMLGRKVMLVEGNYSKSRDVFKSSIEKSFPNVTLHSAKDISDWVAGR